jgi:hypothetical protein
VRVDLMASGTIRHSNSRAIYVIESFNYYCRAEGRKHVRRPHELRTTSAPTTPSSSADVSSDLIAFSDTHNLMAKAGIIAAPLPALKPLLTRLLDAARGLASGQTGSGYKGRELSYHRHNEEPDNAKHGAGRTVSMFTRSNDAARRLWQSVEKRGSKDSILPLQNLASNSNSIVVTRDYTVERR